MPVSCSGLLTVVIEMPPPEWEEDGPELISVEGSRESEGPDVLSDVEWFEEEWSNVGLALLCDEKDLPADGKQHTFKGRLVVQTCNYYGETELLWEEEP